MPQYFDEIPEFLRSWIKDQKVFWVATAPLTPDGLVNISPKGVQGTFHVENPNKVWYEDLTGSGVETIAHVRENSRITILFNAFEGPPRILRLYGKGTVYEFGSPEYESILPPDKRQIGSRSIIMIDVFKVITSCGFGVPFYTYKAPRHRLQAFFTSHERADIAAEKELDMSCGNSGAPPPPPPPPPPRPQKGLKHYWFTRNMKSLDGLPGFLSGYESTTRFQPFTVTFPKDDERAPVSLPWGLKELDLKPVVGFVVGVVVSASYFKFLKYA